MPSIELRSLRVLGAPATRDALRSAFRGAFRVSLGLAAGLCASSAAAQKSPEEAVAGLKAIDGLEATLFAAEPMLANPTAMDIDAEGRVWVTEGVVYRTALGRPNKRPEGDRIVVLEDADGDGKADSSRAFFQDPAMHAPLGIAVLGRRVYVCSAPDLFYLEDTDGDGKADKKTVVLTGFKGTDHDHTLHGLLFAADGWLYMSVGDEGLDVTDKSGNRVWVQKNPKAPNSGGSVLRADLEGQHLQLLADGFRNPYEPAVNSFGEIFISDNDDDGNEECRIAHVMRGANYGYWPFRKGDRHLDEVHWNEDLPGVMPKILRTGFGSPTGLLFYEGSLLPERWRLSLIHADAGPGIIRSVMLAHEGSSYDAEAEVLLSSPEDKWFRPSDACVAPDGSVFLTDWYDPGVGGHNLRDWTQGRVYRLAPKGVKYAVPAMDLTNAAGRAGALMSPNQARRFMAYQGISADVSGEATAALEMLYASDDPIAKARALWLLESRGETGRKVVLNAAASSFPDIRMQSARLIARQYFEPKGTGGLGEDVNTAIDGLVHDPNPAVRRQLALELAPFNAQPAAEKWLIEIARQHDPADRRDREVLGIAMRGREADYFAALAPAKPELWSDQTFDFAVQLHPPAALAGGESVMLDKSAPLHARLRGVGVLAGAPKSDAPARLIGALGTDQPAELIDAALKALIAYENRLVDINRDDARLKSFLKEALRDEKLRPLAQSLVQGVRLHELTPDLVAMAKDASLPKAERLTAIDKVGSMQSSFSVDPLAELLTNADPEIVVAAARAILAVGNDQASEAIKAFLLAGGPVEVRRETVRLLGANKSGALMLINLEEEGTLPKDLRLDAAAAASASPFEDVRLMAAQSLPLEQTREGAAVPPIAELIKMTGDAKRGRDVFFGEDGPKCVRCHMIAGEGRSVGPDLSKIGEKLAPEAIYESILNPSAAISHEYKVWIVRSRSKGYLNGTVRNEDEKGLEITDANGETTKLKKFEILEKYESSTSLMPTGLSSGMTVQNLVDLQAFLKTQK